MERRSRAPRAPIMLVIGARLCKSIAWSDFLRDDGARLAVKSKVQIMEIVKIALAICAGLIPILLVAKHLLDRANRIL